EGRRREDQESARGGRTGNAAGARAALNFCRAGVSHAGISMELMQMINRRDFSRAAGAVLTASLALPSLAQQRFESGKDYLPLAKPAPVEAPTGKVEVIEFFWYNCPHCNAFEPTLEAWVKRLPKDVSMRRVPVAFNSSFQGQQQLYYALEALGL